eukprot:1828431-Prymnesium_polylepis.1
MPRARHTRVQATPAAPATVAVRHLGDFSDRAAAVAATAVAAASCMASSLAAETLRVRSARSTELNDDTLREGGGCLLYTSDAADDM